MYKGTERQKKELAVFRRWEWSGDGMNIGTIVSYRRVCARAGEANFSSNAAFIAERSAAVTVPCIFLMLLLR